MEKITFTFSDTGEKVEFFVLEQTKFQGYQYLLVTDSDDEEEEADAYILKDLSGMEEKEASYVMVEDEQELTALSEIFEELLEDVDFELQEDEN